MNSIIIIGSQHHNTIGTIRCFTDKGISVIVFVCGVKTSYIRKMRYIKMVRCFENGEDAIRELSNKQYYGSIVINCTDETALMLDKYKNDIECKVSFFEIKDSKHGIRYYMDKIIQVRIAAALNIRFPKSWSTSERGSECFPCIIKPLATVDGGKHIEICNNSKEYEQLISSFGASPVIVQEYIEKEEEIVILGVAIGEEIIIPGYVHKIRESHGGTNYSIVYPVSSLPCELVNKTKCLVGNMRYEGLFGVEYVRKGEQYYFIEANLRVDATSYALCRAGVNLPYIYYLYKTGNDYKNEIPSQIVPTHAMVEIQDLYNAVIKKEIGIIEWYRQFKDSECKYYFNRGEISFLLSAFWSIFFRHIAKLSLF